MKKLGLGLGFAVLGLLAACGGSADNETTIRIGATAVPHAEILGQAREAVVEQGFELEIVIFDDFITPNIALDSGEIDMNFYQHSLFLGNFNENHNTDLVAAFGVHFEPFRVYAGRLDTLENIPNGASIAIPDDPTNEARALEFLQYLGLIELNTGLGINATVQDVSHNPHNLDIRPMEAFMLPRVLPDVDFAVINANIALNGEVFYRAIDGAVEQANSNFINYIVVRSGDENSQKLQALINAISTDHVRNFIYETYENRVLPQF